MRDIKSLSDKDIQSLQNGTGEAFGGMAKLAELNGYPGPRQLATSHCIFRAISVLSERLTTHK